MPLFRKIRAELPWLLSVCACSASTAAPPDAAVPTASPPAGASREAPIAEPPREAAQTPEQAAPSEAAPSADTAPREPSYPPGEPSPETPAPGEAEERRQAPLEMLTGAEVAFMINYPASAPKAAAEKTCDEKAAADPKLRADCLAEARDAFVADVIRFTREPAGTLWWTTYKRRGASLAEVHKGQLQLVQESDDAVTFAAKGRETGSRALFRGKSQLVVGVPNSYSIVVEDPTLGRLVYDAKIGLVQR